MRTKHLPTRILFAGVLSIAVGGCATSSTGDDDTGGTTGGAEASGGAAAGGSSATTGGSGPAVTGGNPGTGGSTAQPVTGGTTSSGGSTQQPPTGGTNATGGAALSGGSNDTGGRAAGGTSNVGGRGGRGGRGGSDAAGGGGSSNASGGTEPSGGTTSDGGRGGAEIGGDTGNGGATNGGRSSGGSSAGGTTAATGGVSDGPCTASKASGSGLSGTGTHKVVMETNSDISCGTIYRPQDLGGDEKYPIFVWAEGACSRNGTSNQAAMAEIASHGYFVVADGPPNGGGNCGSISMEASTAEKAKPLLDYVTWAIAENAKTCSAYFGSIETTKVAADGFSCGGLMAESTAGDPRMTTWGVTSSGLTAPDQKLYDSIHTPVKILVGGEKDVAYENGQRDYQNISPLGFPIVFFSKNIGHGGDLGGNTGNGGDFTKVNLAWLNWRLKGDVTATGKGFLVGDTCTFCKDSAWEVKSANLD
jgi:hypothetical protein